MLDGWTFLMGNFITPITDEMSWKENQQSDRIFSTFHRNRYFRNAECKSTNGKSNSLLIFLLQRPSNQISRHHGSNFQILSDSTLAELQNLQRNIHSRAPTPRSPRALGLTYVCLHTVLSACWLSTVKLSSAKRFDILKPPCKKSFPFSSINKVV